MKQQITDTISAYGQSGTLFHATGKRTRVYVVFGTSEENEQGDNYTLTQKIAFCSAPSSKNTPEVGDRLVVGNERFAVMSVQTYKPSNYVLAYKLGLS